MGPMFVQHSQHRLTVDGESGKGFRCRGDASGLQIPFAGHQGGHCRRVSPPRIGIIREPQRHEEGPEVGIA